MTECTQVFISYSRKDREWVDRLLIMLKPYIRSSELDVWEDSRIEAGAVWKDGIESKK